jgi:excisionase family DNA binding protein
MPGGRYETRARGVRAPVHPRRATRTNGRRPCIAALRRAPARLAALEARLAHLEPDDEGLTYKQAARLLGVSAKTIHRWVYAGRIAAGGGTPRSPRILRSEVRRVLEGSAIARTPPSSGNAPVAGVNMTALARELLSAGAKSRRRV